MIVLIAIITKIEYILKKSVCAKLGFIRIVKIYPVVNFVIRLVSTV